MEQQEFKCSGDCLKCHPNQRAYCSSQFTYNTMRMVDDIRKSVSTMQGTVDELKAKIEAIQNNEANIFNPSDIAQSGVGAENRSPETINA